MCIERFSVMQYSALAVSSNFSKMSSLFHSCYYQHTSCLESYSGMSLYDCHRPSRPTIVYYFRVDQEFADSSPKVYIDCRFPFRSIVFQEAHNSFVLFYFCSVFVCVILQKPTGAEPTSQPENQRVKGWTGGRVPTPRLLNI